MSWDLLSSLRKRKNTDEVDYEAFGNQWSEVSYKFVLVDSIWFINTVRRNLHLKFQLGLKGCAFAAKTWLCSTLAKNVWSFWYRWFYPIPLICF